MTIYNNNLNIIKTFPNYKNKNVTAYQIYKNDIYLLQSELRKQGIQTTWELCNNRNDLINVIEVKGV